MQIITYLSFTLVSLFIQFSVIDFIQGRLKLDENPIEMKGVSQKRQLRDVLKDASVKPHALYYRTQKYKGIKNESPAKFISNITLTKLLATTDMTTTVLDILYDENFTNTEETFTTESFYTTTIDIENITEITFFENSNETTAKNNTTLKKTITKDCSCNFQIKACDIDCCCDLDCLDSEIDLFPNCEKNKITTKEEKADDEYCESQLFLFGYENSLFCIVKVNLPEKGNSITKLKVNENSLFCIVKVNLPEKGNSITKLKNDPVATNHYLTWKTNEKSRIFYEFSNSIYKYGDPIWLYKNNTIYHTDVPIPSVNNYCTGRKALQFLKNEKYKCNVKINDLEMFQIIKSLDEVAVISATPLSMNSSVLNCSNLHCVNWTRVVCYNLVCTNYNRHLHEPACTERICTNLALKIDYIFHYYDSKIINATIQFHLENITLGLPYMSQEIQVKFVVGNESIDRILRLSGNPGYVDGLPIIISYEENNHTDSFFNNTKQSKRYLLLPENKKGFCTSLNSSQNFVLFGRNRRLHCRYNHKPVKTGSATEQCKRIQNDINELLKLDKHMAMSPLGNPLQIKDKEWVSAGKSFFNGTLFGEYQNRSSKLLCYNLVLRFLMTFNYAQINGHKRILSANFVTTSKNATFNLDDISSVITIDISFIDVTRPSVLEYIADHPSVNLHLPDDFFNPFRSNESRALKSNMFTMTLYFITYFLQIK